MVEQVLDLATVAAAAVGALAVAGMHQVQHGALQLRRLLLALLIAEADVGLADLLCLGLQHTFVGVVAPVTDVWWGLVNLIPLSLLRGKSWLCLLLTQAEAAAQRV